MAETLISFIIATAALAISPGPDNIFVLTQSIVYGKKKGLAIVAGLMAGCLVHTSLVAFGVSVILKENQQVFWAIKILGAVYLLYLAYRVYQSDAKIQFSVKNEKGSKSYGKLFRIGFLMNVLNPKVTLFFLALLPQFLFSSSIAVLWQFYILGFLFIAVSFIVFGAIAVFAGQLAKKIRNYPRAGWYLKWLQIIVFVGIAIFILV